MNIRNVLPIFLALFTCSALLCSTKSEEKAPNKRQKIVVHYAVHTARMSRCQLQNSLNLAQTLQADAIARLDAATIQYEDAAKKYNQLLASYKALEEEKEKLKAENEKYKKINKEFAKENAALKKKSPAHLIDLEQARANLVKKNSAKKKVQLSTLN